MREYGLSGSALKLIAVVTMLIDHVGAAVLARFLVTGSWTKGLYFAYETMRTIGRVAFPIYCFLLVEGFMHTRSLSRYAGRLAAFALVSEVPFDLAFSGVPLEFGYQNVYFTLLIGLLAITAAEWLAGREGLHPALRVAWLVLCLFAGMGIAYLMHTDYDAKGVLCIFVLYLFRQSRPLQIIAGCLAFGWFELPALVAFIPIAFYNGKRGFGAKYFFYLFYPVHLLIIYAVCAALGMGGVAVV